MDRLASAPNGLAPIVEGVRNVLKAGLPVRPQAAPSALVDLPNVIARATVANDILARVDALDRLLRDELRRLGLPELRKAGAVLFGATGGGGTLTERRRHAADRSDYELHHFRKRIEPKILEQLAWQLYQGSLQFTTRRNGPEPVAVSGDTPVIKPEQTEEPKTAEQEILLSEIWSEVYGLRAALIAREIARGDSEKVDQAKGADMAALWRLARLLTRLDSYLEKFGRSILHGEAEYDANALIRLAGWSGEVTKEEARALRFALAKAGEWDQDGFRTALD
jgi:hypothetical protein